MPFSQSAQDALLKWVCECYVTIEKERLERDLDDGGNGGHDEHVLTATGTGPLLWQVNNGFPNAQTAHSFDDLADGVILAQVLQDIDPEFDPTELDQQPTSATPKWLVKKKTLIGIHKALFRYIHSHCPELEFLSKRSDVHTLDEQPTHETVGKLVAAMVAVAFLGPDPAKYVGRLQEPGSFDTPTMREIQQVIIAIKEERDSRMGEMGNDEETLEEAMESRDAGLAFEAERAYLINQLDSAKKQAADTITRLEHLQESFDALQLQEIKLQRELDVLRKATQDGASDSHVIKNLQHKIKEQEELITNQEAQAEDDRLTKTRLQSQVTTLTQKTERAEQLEDELRELRHRNDELSRKANAAERYRQKLEQQQNIAIEVQNLRFEKDQLLKKSQEYDKVVQKNALLERTISELRSAHAQAEESIFILGTKKKALEDSNLDLMDQITRLTEMRSNDERFIAELQEQAGLSTTTEHPGAAPVSLEEELEGTSQPQGALALELNRLKAENALLKRGLGSGETSQLRSDLEEEQRKYNELRNKYAEIVERHSVAQDQLSALVNDAAGEGSVHRIDETLSKLSHHLLNEDFYRTRAFNELRTQLLQANTDLKREAQRAAELQAQLSDHERDLLMARTELSAVSKDGTEALEELKSTDTLVSASLREELDALRARVKALEADNELNKSQLLDAYVAKDKLHKENEELKSGQAPVDAKNINDEAIAEEVNKSTEKIQKLRERLKERQEQLAKSEQEKYELQRKLKSALSGGGSASQKEKAAAEQTIKNLQREISLITSAWYDLSSRLQSNNVVLQRRNDAPRSWLNKQRQLVNATPRR
ncbi:hypothetical protein jhhlp_000437 [Lomentospora prolificans]|uniref:HOOK N-terminal domain-containing protein n=1 Tax=Lomentospora prolificans TaxID=41688 RepID=A0A2N3NKU8_9PEZI|nr:hypothetical protein jhhlp_000437 [Lomentospora prolificans]